MSKTSVKFKQECKHKETHYYYTDYARNNMKKEHHHVCDMMACIEGGTETKKCIFVKSWWHK